MNNKFNGKIDCLYVSLSENCNLGCIYCVSEEGLVKTSNNERNLSIEEYKFFIRSMSEMGINKVRFSGLDKSQLKELSLLVKFVKEECGIEDISIITSGVDLDSIISELYYCGLKSVSINLDSLKEYKYKSITRGGQLKDIFKLINKSLKLGLKVEINCLVIDKFNDDEIKDFLVMTKTPNLNIRFVELMPIGEAYKFYDLGYINVKEILTNLNGIYNIGSEKNCLFTQYKFSSYRGEIGVISYNDNYIYNRCNNIMITSKGSLKSCSSDDINIYKYVNKPILFRESLKEILLEKCDVSASRNNYYKKCMY